MLGQILVGFALGIAAADSGFRPAFLKEVASGGAVALTSAVGFSVAALLAARPAAQRSERNAFLRPGDAPNLARAVVCLGLVLGLAFFAGVLRLDRRLELARRDAVLAELSARTDASKATDRGAIRFLEARVDSRRPRSWGDEIVLSSVVPMDEGNELPGRLRLYLDRTDPVTEAEPGDTPAAGDANRAEVLLWPGVRARMGMRIQPIRGERNPGSEDREWVAARRGLGAQARLVDPNWVVAIDRGGRWGSRWWERVHAARIAWRDRVRDRFTDVGASAGFARALAIGDRSGLDTGLREAFRRLGLAHLIAVSGLHVSMIAAAAGWMATRFFVLAFIGRRSHPAPFLMSLASACLAAAAYGWAAGAAVSVQRAVLLFAFFAVFRTGKRTVRPAEALAGVALLILLLEPAMLFELGARLSFLACTGLVVAGLWEESGMRRQESDPPSFLERAGRSVAASLRASLAVSLATAPALLGAGLALPLLAPVWNAVAIPWTALLALPASLMAVILRDVLPGAVLRGLLLPAEGFESAVLALDELTVPMPATDGLPIWLAVFAASVGLLCVRLRRFGFVVFAWWLVAFVGSPPLLHGKSEPAPEPPRIVFFDVGQGDAALIQGREATMLIDTGGGRNDETAGRRLVRGLRALGARHVDVLVITHGDLDHRAGANRVLAELPVTELWLPVGAEQDPPIAALAHRAKRGGVRVRWLAAGGDPIDRGDLRVEVLWPAGADSFGRSRNEASLVLLVALGGTRALFAADVGAPVEASLLEDPARLRADLLKVGHHGSRSSSTAGFLEAVAPRWAVVSAPCKASRGLPNAAILDRFAASGISLGWTGRDGAVFLRAEAGARGSLRTWASPRRCRDGPASLTALMGN